MPDLIIKPTATSGNKLILKDQAGGAVLTTADSGATFSGGNIGTVTAGAINGGSIGSAVTGFTGIKECDRWKITSGFQHDTTGEVIITANWARSTIRSTFTKIGTGMTESSGIFTFPSTGQWVIDFQATGYINSSAHKSGEVRYYRAFPELDTGSGYNPISGVGTSTHYMQSSYTDMNIHTTTIFTVSDVSTHKCRFKVHGFNDNTNTLGDNTLDYTYVDFIRLGDV